MNTFVKRSKCIGLKEAVYKNIDSVKLLSRSDLKDLGHTQKANVVLPAAGACVDITQSRFFDDWLGSVAANRLRENLSESMFHGSFAWTVGIYAQYMLLGVALPLASDWNIHVKMTKGGRIFVPGTFVDTMESKKFYLEDQSPLGGIVSAKSEPVIFDGYYSAVQFRRFLLEEGINNEFLVTESMRPFAPFEEMQQVDATDLYADFLARNIVHTSLTKN